MNHQTPPNNFDFDQALEKMDRRTASEASVHFICAGLARNGQKLAVDQKVDIVRAMIDMHRTATIAEFLRVITEDYALMKEGDDEHKAEQLRRGIAYAILTVEPKVAEFSGQLTNLAEMLFLAGAQNSEEAKET